MALSRGLIIKVGVTIFADMSYSLNSLKGSYIGDYIGEYYIGEIFRGILGVSTIAHMSFPSLPHLQALALELGP